MMQKIGKRYDFLLKKSYLFPVFRIICVQIISPCILTNVKLLYDCTFK
jgi:hypothetical protein